MGFFWKPTEQPVADTHAATLRSVQNSRPCWLAILLALVWFVATVQADEPFAFGRDHLESVVKGPQVTPPSTADEGSLILLAVIVVAALLAWLVVVRIINRRFSSQTTNSKTEADSLRLLYQEEPSLASFLEQLRTGTAPPLTYTDAHLPTKTKGDSLMKFFDSAPAEIAKLQGLLVEVSRASDATSRQKKLRELSDRFRSLNYDSCQTELTQVWQMSSALEGLVKQIASAETNVTSSGLQTVAGALDLLRLICVKRLKPRPDHESPARLLVVDDDAVCRFALSAAVKKVFASPDLSPDGETALSLVNRQAYDAIFLDVEMPGLNGFELCEKIRETDLNRSTPVVFVTRHSDFDSRAKAVLSGGQHLLGKPFLALEVTVKALTLVLRSRLEQGEKTLKTAGNHSKPGLPPDPAGQIDAPAKVERTDLIQTPA